MAIPKQWAAARYARRADIARAQSFKLVAEEYDRGRPGYPAAAIEWLLGKRTLDVVDLGAGTGKLTAGLAAARHRVRAVEPVAEMRTVLQRHLPGVEVVAATAERTGLPANSADAVVAAAAFHWFDRERTFPEITRILRPSGTLGLLANGLDTSAAWVARLRELLGDHELGLPQAWPATDELLSWFDTVEERRFAHAHEVDLSRVLDLAISRSSIATLPPADRRAALARISTLWHDEPELRDRERVALPYVTRVMRAVRRRVRRPARTN